MRKTLIVFACAILCAGFAGAQPTESVCDGEQGAAYGLCNAFCDAMDCDGDPQASETACNKVQSKFEQVTGHAPPCLEPQLSCVCNEALPNFLAIASAPGADCIDVGDYIYVEIESVGAVAVDESAGSCSAFPGNVLSGTLQITPAEGVECMAFLRSLCQ